MNMRYFDFLGGLTMTNRRFDELFGGPPRTPETTITRREMDLARSIQEVTEEIVLRMANHAAKLTGEVNACLAGGVALNCVANGRLLREGPFERIWVQPAAGDAGGAIGSALYGWHQIQGNKRVVNENDDGMSGAYLGPEFSDEEVERYLEACDYPYTKIPERSAWARRIAELVADGNVVGLFVGRMEFGPRALGHRSIIADPRSPKMQSIMNLKIKYRESFRPFAPSVLAERSSDFFDLDVESPYMMLVAPVRECLRNSNGDRPHTDIRAWVNEIRSTIPAVTHVDFSARIQTVNQTQSPDFHAVIEAFHALTGCPVVINTSFNVRGEPIVCTPADAYRCFMRTEIDHLALGPFLLEKRSQPEWVADDRWQADLILD
jgi:carbamoyltransferase